MKNLIPFLANVQTGNNFNPTPVIVIGLIAVSAAIVAVFLLKKK